MRQDLLDGVVWAEIVRLLEDPELIHNELDRRLAAAREADPTKRREEALRRDLVRIRKSIDRLLTAYQEGLLSLDELRERMPNLRRREQADNAELQAIVDQSLDRTAYLRLAETLATFLTRLRSSAGALDVLERQRVLRLLVKEDAEDYAAFQMAVTADYDAHSAVERELVLRLASLLWRLRRATAIETGLFKVQARYLLRHKKKPENRRERPQAGDRTSGDVIRLEDRGVQQYGYQPATAPHARSLSAAASGNRADDLTRSFVRLNNLATCPLDRLSRYEAMLWRQACQLLFTLQFMSRRKPWDKLKLRP